MKRILTLLLLGFGSLSYGQNYVVQMQGGSFIPQEHLLTPPGSDEMLINNRYYRVVQFYNIPTTEEKQWMEEKGIRLYNYLPNNCFMASVSASLPVASFLDYKNIRSVFRLAPEFRRTADLTNGSYPDYALRGKGTIELAVSHHPDISPEDVNGFLQRDGATIVHRLPDVHTFRVTVPFDKIAVLASVPYLYFIEPVDNDPQPDNLEGRTNHRSNYIAADYAGGLQYDGTGISVAMNDDGVIGPHIDYTGRIIGQFISNNNGNHGDHCAGTIFGAGNINPVTRGMAHGAHLGVYGVGSSFSTSYQAFDSLASHYTKYNIRITSTSYSDGSNTGYTTRARLMDIQTNSYPDLLHVFSAGNAGTADQGYGAGAGWGNITGGHKQAKNVVTVGNLTFTDALNNSSSRGPAKDGRIKPDICAVGTNVVSTIDPHTYQSKTGTSMACPGVAGILAQLYHAYRDMNNNAYPSSALIKATILNTADDLGNPGPDYRHGFGRINARRAFRLLQNNQYLFDSVSHTNTNQHTINVPAGVAELRVMLYWHDREATAGVAKALVNNLDMTVITPASQTVLPWILNPTPTATALNTNAVQGVDTLNNVEQVTIVNPASGNYVVNVNGFSVPFGPQRYVVVYEFVMNGITVTYPAGGESLVPAVTETIRWDAWGNTGNFTLQYSVNNGATWTNISTSVNGSARHFSWMPPSTVTGEALIRVSRGTVSDQSDAIFSIIGVPFGSAINWVCLDSFSVSYSNVNGATGYIVTVLGNNYMDSAGFSTTTTCVVKGVNTTAGGWYSVQAVGPNGAIGRRMNAQQRPVVPVNCVVPNDLGVVSYVSPVSTSVVNCQMTSLSEQVSISIKNNGLSPLGNTLVSYSVNGGVPVVETINSPIAGQATITHTFTQPLVFTMPGTYTIQAWVDNIQDMIPVNDTITWKKEIVQPPLVSLPLYEDFETFIPCDTSANCQTEVCQLNTGWRNEVNGTDDDIDWRIHSGPTPSGSMSGTTGPVTDLNPGTVTGQYAYLEAGDCYAKTASIISPCLDLTNAQNPVLSMGYHMFGSGMGSLHVDALVNGVWMNDINQVISGNQGNNWNIATVNLSAFIGQIIALRIRGVTGINEESDIAIDDLKITDVTKVTDATDRTYLQISPNPSEGIYRIQLSKSSGATAVRVADINGRLVQEHIFNGTVTIVDIKTHPPGVYLLSIKNDNGIIHKKLIKQ